MGYSFADFVNGKKIEKRSTPKQEIEESTEPVSENDDMNEKKIDMLIEEVKLLRREIKELKSVKISESYEPVTNDLVNRQKPRIKVHNGIDEQINVVNESGFDPNEINSHVAGILG